MPDVRLAEITDKPIDRDQLISLVSRPRAGAISLFLGTVRDNDPQASSEVTALNYTCHPSSYDAIGEIAARVLAVEDPHDECSVALAHRIGRLVVGDSAFVVAVSSAHRALAMHLCERLVEQVKNSLPMWKQQFESDGTYRWSGL
ncbi:MAG TPA: molybdenum cofactor biosynthesis protein MoaE [Dermatophilaceae bacterium]